MPRKEIAKFSIEYLQIVDEEGIVDKKLFPKECDERTIKAMYQSMMRARIFDAKMISLQRQGRLGTFASVAGHEAAQVGSIFAKEAEDWVFPYFRQWAAFLALGLPMEKILQYNAGDERGMQIPDKIPMFPVNIPVASQIPHAVGFAWGLQLQKKKGVALCYLGDGATSKGDFHEALNFAGVFHIPVVFICENNQYAISVPREKQTAAETLAQKAIAYGIEGIQIDGNDVVAVYQATKEALTKAKKGMPVLIECITYRLGDHTTADDASRYRPQKEVEAWQKKDPLKRIQLLLKKEYAWSSQDEERVQKKIDKEIQEAVTNFETIQPQEREAIFRWQYAEMTQALKEQLREGE